MNLVLAINTVICDKYRHHSSIGWVENNLSVTNLEFCHHDVHVM